MNITLMKLRGIERELARLNDNIESLLLHAYDIRPARAPRPASPDDKLSVTYTDETEDALTEELEARDKMRKWTRKVSGEREE